MKKKTRLDQMEEAIIMLADYAEDVSHADYKVKKHILEILGLEEVEKPPQGDKLK